MKTIKTRAEYEGLDADHVNLGKRHWQRVKGFYDKPSKIKLPDDFAETFLGARIRGYWANVSQGVEPEIARWRSGLDGEFATAESIPTNKEWIQAKNDLGD